MSMDTLTAEILRMIAAELDIPENELTPASALGTHFKWDSMGHVTVMVALEKKYGFEIDDTNIERLQSISDIKDYIAQYAK